MLRCRHLEVFDESFHCALYDNSLKSSEAAKCGPGGWDYYEEDQTFEEFLKEEGVTKTANMLAEPCNHPDGSVLELFEGRNKWCGLCGHTWAVSK